MDGTLPGRPHPADRAPRARPRRRRHPRPRAAHRGGDAAGRGARAGADLHQLPPGARPEPLVGPRRRRAPAAPPARRLRPGRAGGDRHRRDHRAPLGRQDQGARHLPRPGPLQPRPLRQGQRPALDHGDAPRPDPLGRPGLGPAVPDRAGALGALRARARAAAQDADRPGAPAPAPGRPLAARAPAGRGRRQQLRRHRAARGGPPPPHRGHPAQARRPAVRPAPAAPAGHPRPAPPVGRAPADPGRAPGRPEDPLAAGHGRGLVRPHRAADRARSRARRSGITRASGSRSAGSWSATSRASSSRRASCAPTRTPIRSTCCAGSCGGGRSR